jgi:ATP-dependent RNA helicase MSS116
VPHKGARTSSTTRAHMTAARFDGYRGVVSDGTLKAIAEVLGYETMTKVQEQALPVCTRGRDVVAKAKTGTGKTLAFMIPCVDRAAASKAKRNGSKISALVLSPTRELAQQTLEEGRLLSHFHGLTLASVPNSNLQLDFNVSVFECFDTSSSAGLRELDESDRSVQKSAESTSI